MVDPYVPLGVVAFVGTAPSAGIVSARHADANRWSRELEAIRLEVPQGCDPIALRNFLASLSGLLPGAWGRLTAVRGIGFEIVATSRGITHYLLVPKSQKEIVMTQLRANLPGVRPVPIDTLTMSDLSIAGELMTVRPDHQLRIDAPGVVSSSILAALQPLEGTDEIRLLILAMPIGIRQSPTSKSQGILQFLSHSETEVRPDPRFIKKYAEPMFSASIRFGVATNSPARGRQIMARLTAAFHSANSPDAVLRRRRINAKAVIDGLMNRKPPVYGSPCRLNAAELTGLVALPPQGTSLSGLRLGGSRVLSAATDIPILGTVIADSNYPGSHRPIALSQIAATHHLTITSPPGTGKSTLIINMAVQNMDDGDAVFSIDFKGDTNRDLVNRIPEHRIREVTIIEPLDSRPVGLNILHSTDGDPDLAAEQIYGILHNLNRESWGPRLADILRTALHTLARTPGATLVDLPRLLTDSRFRASVVGSLDDPLGLSAVWSWIDGLSEGERAQEIAPILNKIRPLVVREKLRHVLGQSDPLLNFDEALADGRILLASFSAGELGDDAAALLGAVVLTNVMQAVMRRSRLPKAERRPVFIYIDEAQVLGKLPVPLADFMAVARSMNCAIVIANQSLHQFEPQTREIILAASRSRVIFQTNASDAARFAKDLAPYVTAEDLKGLQPYEIVASLSTGDRVAPPATGLTRPMSPANEFGPRVRELSRQRWGRDRDEVEAELRRRQEGPGGSGPIGRQRRSK